MLAAASHLSEQDAHQYGIGLRLCGGVSAGGAVLGLVLGMIIAETGTSMLETLTQNESGVGVMAPPDIVTFKTSLGLDVQANVVHLKPQAITFELHGPETVLRSSELLGEFKILADNTPIYTGRAVVSGMMNSGTGTLCEASLSVPLIGFESLEHHSPEQICETGFGVFLKRWEKFYRVHQDYKVVIADIQTFLSNLRLWLEQIELTLQTSPPFDRAKRELEIAQGLRHRITPALTNMFERFEAIADQIEPELVPGHRAFGQRQLHSCLLCGPFIHRTYSKPLGYAGDYEMMNMIVRNRFEGNSLYAKLVDAYLLDQVGPQAVRNRVDYLQARIADETCRVARAGRVTRIYNIACGPAREAQNFIAEHPLADQTEFHLLDFDEETLAYVGGRMDEVRKRHQRRTSIQLVKKSVQKMLRASTSQVLEEASYDLIYCSGLYDYLNDRVIKALNTYLYDQLRPGGLLTVGNFAPNMPVRNFIEHFLEWFLIYRDANHLATLAPHQASPADCRVVAEPTGTNIFLEVRKPL